MGFVESLERKTLEIEEVKQMLVACAGLNRRKDDEDLKRLSFSSKRTIDEEADGEKVVCVTSGVSFIGLAIVNQLTCLGYSVRIIVHNEDEIEILRELETSNNNNVQPVMANLTDTESLTEAFAGCRGVFHTSAFTDPTGLSGYTKSMAEIEVKTTEIIIKACSRTPSVRNCVLTSSLLACVWRDGTSQNLSPVINHESWSDESICLEKKLWYALGKLRAEKVAWRIAKENGLKLVAICPGLVTGPEFLHRNPTATIAYLKGASEMYAEGLLATVDVKKLAEAHVCVFQEMNKTAFGRYICFDRVIHGEDEAEKLAKEIGMPGSKICGSGNASNNIQQQLFELSNKKLCTLMSRKFDSCYNQSQKT